MPTSLCCLVRRDMCDRYPEQISGKFPQRERKKQIPIHLMKVRALKARKGKRERRSVIKVLGDSRSKREYLSLYFLRAMYSLFHKRACISFDGRNYVCSRNEYDRLPKSGYYMHSTTTFYRELEHATDVHLSHAFRRASLLRDAYVMCRYSLLLIF